MLQVETKVKAMYRATKLHVYAEKHYNKRSTLTSLLIGSAKTGRTAWRNSIKPYSLSKFEVVKKTTLSLYNIYNLIEATSRFDRVKIALVGSIKWILLIFKERLSTIDWDDFNRRYPMIGPVLYNGIPVILHGLKLLIVGLALALGLFKPWDWHDYVNDSNFVDLVFDGKLMVLMEPLNV